MVTRAIWPLAAYYPKSSGFTNLKSLVDDDDDDDYDVAVGDDANVLAIDALEYVEISRSDGKIKRVCTRARLFVPWTPILYVAVHPSYASEFRRRINCRLMMERRSPIVVTIRARVCGLVRASHHVLWTLEDSMELCELRFDSYTSRSVALRYLKDNAHARAHQYLLLVTADSASVAVEIALASYFRCSSRDDEAATASIANDNDDDDDDDDDDDADEEKDAAAAKKRGIDLRRFFEMGAWCKLSDRRFTGVADQYIEKMSPREIRLNRLPSDPLAALPVVSYDIETIARMDSTLPRGVEEDQRLSSVAITVHVRHQRHGCGTVVIAMPIYLAYVPMDVEPEEMRRHEALVCDKLRAIGGEEAFARSVVRFHRDERSLLCDAIRILGDNEYFMSLYRLDPTNARRMAALLIGYNSWEYDYTFLAIRCLYYGMYNEAFRVLRFSREPRFTATQLSIDLMKHVKVRYAAQLGSIALKHVSAYFGAMDQAERDTSARSRREKMAFDAVSIRRMYFDGDGGEERFDRDMAFGELDIDRGVNMLRVSLYNLQDCTAVYYLQQNLSLLPSISLYSRHFYATPWDSSHAGNSVLLPNVFVVLSLQNRIMLPFRSNEFSLTSMAPPRAIGDGTAAAAAATNNLIAPCSPFEIMARWGVAGDRSSSRYFDQVSVMRLDEKKLYIGGINSATSGHYARPICVDFASFYPSIGIQYQLSMETVCIVTCDHLLTIHDRDETLLDRTIAAGLVRCFDYEPPDSPHRRTDASLRGRDEFAAAVLRHNNGWYEGVEFASAREIIDSSADGTRRRVLVIYRTASRLDDPQPPVICSMWRYYLNMRQEYKTRLHDTTDVFQRRALSCKEKMFKVVANSLYGYLNYIRSVVYSPQVAAAVTLLSRKTFHETAWICETVFPATVAAAVTTATHGGDGEENGGVIECEVVYRDTDGLIVHTTQLDGEAISADQQREYESVLPSLINDTFSRYGYDSIRIELEDARVESCCIMGKKKYWKSLISTTDDNRRGRRRFVTKGFEKNAQSFVKHVVAVLQLNVSRIVSAVTAAGKVARCRLLIANHLQFFAAMYTTLHRYYTKHGASEFSFNLALNPRCSGGAEAAFIQRTIERYNYSPGDRVRCVFVLDETDPGATIFVLLRDFRIDVDRLNYYKIIRRLATYFVQLVEGFKRNDTTVTAATARSYCMSAAEFDAKLHTSYAFWLENYRCDDSDDAIGGMNVLFHDDDDDDDDATTSSTNWLDWLSHNSSLLTVVTAGTRDEERDSHPPSPQQQ